MYMYYNIININSEVFLPLIKHQWFHFYYFTASLCVLLIVILTPIINFNIDNKILMKHHFQAAINSVYPFRGSPKVFKNIHDMYNELNLNLIRFKK